MEGLREEGGEGQEGKGNTMTWRHFSLPFLPLTQCPTQHSIHGEQHDISKEYSKPSHESKRIIKMYNSH